MVKVKIDGFLKCNIYIKSETSTSKNFENLFKRQPAPD